MHVRSLQGYFNAGQPLEPTNSS